MNVYLCTKCGRQAKKPACKKGEGASLGTWRCDRCGVTSVKIERAS